VTLFAFGEEGSLHKYAEPLVSALGELKSDVGEPEEVDCQRAVGTERIESTFLASSDKDNYV
jgi:hypothetical protein